MKTTFALLITIAFFAVSHWQLTNAEQLQCRKPVTAELFEKLEGRFLGTHVIGTASGKKKIFGSSSPISCGQFINKKTVEDNKYDDTFMFIVNEAPVTIHGKKIFGDNGRLVLRPDSLPSATELNVVLHSNGVYVGYFCKENDNEQVIMIGYKPADNTDMDKETDKVAAELTSSPDDYKVDHKNCGV